MDTQEVKTKTKPTYTRPAIVARFDAKELLGETGYSEGEQPAGIIEALMKALGSVVSVFSNIDK